jgi:soluble lytic murein transglycosylase-like protein
MTRIPRNTTVRVIAAVGALTIATGLGAAEVSFRRDTASNARLQVKREAHAQGVTKKATNPSTPDGVVAASPADRRCLPAPGFFSAEENGGFTGAAGRISRAVATGLLDRIHEVSCRLGIHPAIGEGVAWTESRFDPNARSPDGLSFGAFQLTRITASEMRGRLAGASAGLPLHDEVTLGIGYLRYLANLFARRTVLDNRGHTTTPVLDSQERWRFAIAAYNAGEGRVAGAQRRAAAAGKDPARFEDVRPFLPRITRRYVEQVLAFAASRTGSRSG